MVRFLLFIIVFLIPSVVIAAVVPYDPGALPTGPIPQSQLTYILDQFNLGLDALIGVLLALIFAITWKG